MLKKIWFATFVFSAFFSAHAQENDPLPKIEKTIPKEFDHFHYATFGVVYMAPSIGLGIRSQRGHWGNDFSLSGAYFVIVNGLSAQYSRLFYFSKEKKNLQGYCGLGPALNYLVIFDFFGDELSHVVSPSAVVSLGGQFKTKNRTHFIELKGNMVLFDWRELGALPSLSYGVSF